jgi:hypothetical protein
MTIHNLESLSDAALARKFKAMGRARRMHMAATLRAAVDDSGWQFPGLDRKSVKAVAVKKRYRGNGTWRHSMDGARLCVAEIDAHITERQKRGAQLLAGAAPVDLQDALLLIALH